MDVDLDLEPTQKGGEEQLTLGLNDFKREGFVNDLKCSLIAVWDSSWPRIKDRVRKTQH